MATPRKLIAPSHAAIQALRFGPGGDGSLPWDVVGEKLAELLGFLASAVQAIMAELREHAASLFAALGWLARAVLAVALPAAAVVAALVLVYGCCVAVAGQRRRRGPDGEQVDGLAGGGPVVSYRGGYRYKGGIFSMHPNKPMVG